MKPQGRNFSEVPALTSSGFADRSRKCREEGRPRKSAYPGRLIGGELFHRSGERSRYQIGHRVVVARRERHFVVRSVRRFQGQRTVGHRGMGRAAAVEPRVHGPEISAAELFPCAGQEAGRVVRGRFVGARRNVFLPRSRFQPEPEVVTRRALRRVALLFVEVQVQRSYRAVHSSVIFLIETTGASAFIA